MEFKVNTGDEALDTTIRQWLKWDKVRTAGSFLSSKINLLFIKETSLYTEAVTRLHLHWYSAIDRCPSRKG